MIKNNTYTTEWGFNVPVEGVIENLSINNTVKFDLLIKPTGSEKSISTLDFTYEEDVSGLTVGELKTELYDWLINGVKTTSIPGEDGELVNHEEKVLNGDWEKI
jgi:hypothetical protein